MFLLTWILWCNEIWSSEHAEHINAYYKSLVKSILPVNVNSHKSLALFLKTETLMGAGYTGKERIFYRNNVCVLA